MKEFKNKIYKLIKESNTNLSLKDIAYILNIKSNVDFILLNKALNELQDDFLITTNKNNMYIVVDKKSLYRGIISINTKGNGFIELDNSIIRIDNSDLNGALDKDEVIVKINKNNIERGYVKQIVSHNTSSCIGIINFKKGKLTANIDNPKINIYKNIVINSKKYKLVNGLKVKFKIKEYSKNNKPMKLDIDKIIGHKDDPGIDILSILLEHDINPKFPKTVMDEASKISQTVTKIQRKNRLDLTDKLIVTIDGDDSKDFDDAISIEKFSDYYLLGVHIADVSYYIKENSELDLEARKRGTSTYAANTVSSMLPHILSNGICSLNPNVDRLTISCFMKIDLNGEVIDYSITPSLINSKRRMTYNNVNKILNYDEITIKEYEDIKDIFFTMEECSKLIRKRREGLGSINFDKDEAIIKVNLKGKVVDILKKERKESERIIEDFMICANETIALHMKNLNIPCLYRVHEDIDKIKFDEFKNIARLMGYPYKNKSEYPKDIQKYLNSLKDNDNYSVVSSILLRSMPKARYDLNPLGHFGLALKDYLHFTSPIRRYPDLIVHRMLRKYYFKNDFNDYNKDEILMQDLSIETSESERKSIDAERKVMSMKMAEYMENHIGGIFEGTISSVTKFGFFVELDNMVEGLVHISDLKDDYYIFDKDTLSIVSNNNFKRYRIGQRVLVKLISANKIKREIDFKIYEKKSKIKRWR